MAIKTSILLLSPLEVQSTWTYEKSDFSQYSPDMIFPENFNESWSYSVWELSEGFQTTWLILSIQRWFPFLGKGVLFVVLVSVMLVGDSPVVVMSMPFFSVQASPTCCSLPRKSCIKLFPRKQFLWLQASFTSPVHVCMVCGISSPHTFRF